MGYYRSSSAFVPINSRQIRLIKTIQGRLGWDDDAYRAALRQICRAESCKDLSQKQAQKFITFLKAKAAEAGITDFSAAKAPARYMKAKSDERLSEKQREYIVNLWWQVSRGQTSREKLNGLRAFIRRQTGCDALSFVPRSQGPALICAIEAMRSQQDTKKEAVNG